MGISVPTEADEGRHGPGPEQDWNETWYLDFFSQDGLLAGYLSMGLWPNMATSWYWACLVGPGRQLVTVLENEAPLPPAPGLELRCSGLWAEVIPQVPLSQMTVGLEAFGVGMDDAADVYGNGWGDRTPLGFDLEWETIDDAAPVGTGGAGSGGYELPARVHGEILVGHEVIDFDGWGHRHHTWGVRDHGGADWSWAAGRLDDGSMFHASSGGGGLGGIGLVHPRLGDHGFPVSALVEANGQRLELTPIAHAPVFIAGANPRPRLPRTFCAVATPDDTRSGYAWLEMNQPAPQ